MFEAVRCEVYTLLLREKKRPDWGWHVLVRALVQVKWVLVVQGGLGRGEGCLGSVWTCSKVKGSIYPDPL